MTMTFLPILNVFHGIFVEFVGAHANTCSKDGDSPEEIMAQSNPNKCCIGGGSQYFFSSCCGRFVARFLIAAMLAAVTISCIIGIPCFARNLAISLGLASDNGMTGIEILNGIQDILTTYIWPICCCTMTLCVIIAVVMPLTAILSSHKDRRSQNSGSSYMSLQGAVYSCGPFMIIALLFTTLLPALLCFITSYLNWFNSKYVKSFGTLYVLAPIYRLLGLEIKLDKDISNFSNSTDFSNYITIDTNDPTNITLVIIMIILPLLLFILLLCVPCLTACIKTNRKLTKIRKIYKRNQRENNFDQSTNYQHADDNDKYDTLLTNAEGNINNFMASNNNNNNHNNINLGTDRNNHNNNNNPNEELLSKERLQNLDYDVYSSLSHRQSQSKHMNKFSSFYWIKIFLRSIKYSFIPPEDAGVSDNLIAAGQSYHTLDRYEKGGPIAEMIPTDQFKGWENIFSYQKDFLFTRRKLYLLVLKISQTYFPSLDYYDTNQSSASRNQPSIQSYQYKQDNSIDLHLTTTV